MKQIFAVLVFAASLASGVANAKFFSGQELKDLTREIDKADRGAPIGDDTTMVARVSAIGSYMGFVAGVSDALDGLAFCIPAGVTLGQAGAVVNKYLKEHPEEWNESGTTLVARALRQAFPCKK